MVVVAVKEAINVQTPTQACLATTTHGSSDDDDDDDDNEYALSDGQRYVLSIIDHGTSILGSRLCIFNLSPPATWLKASIHLSVSVDTDGFQCLFSIFLSFLLLDDNPWQDSGNAGISIPTDALASGGTAGHDDPHGSRGGAYDGPARRSSRSRSPRDRGRSEESNNPGNNLHVSGLSYKVDSRDLESAFAKIGRVAKASVVYDPHTRESRLFGFVTMESSEEADAAVAALNGTDLMGKTIIVAKPTNTPSVAYTQLFSFFYLLSPLCFRPSLSLSLSSFCFTVLLHLKPTYTLHTHTLRVFPSMRALSFDDHISYIIRPSSHIILFPPSSRRAFTHRFPPARLNVPNFIPFIPSANLTNYSALSFLPLHRPVEAEQEPLPPEDIRAQESLVTVQENAAMTPDPTTLGTPGTTTTATETDGVDGLLVTMMTVTAEEGAEVVTETTEVEEIEMIDGTATDTGMIEVVVETGIMIGAGGIDVVTLGGIGWSPSYVEVWV
ncbi:hypothetical protein D9758_014142 [Tetrapyrgos nigripes]|uniref:RRM domain-containing protein n=1 Tax=Tetrapyrgos nigripes TaxID=182062 RepID=A0A8H5FQ10_9AGAR|nr:hypothetical protein D9758_014142 [Tetrapyrgos nigripes]